MSDEMLMWCGVVGAAFTAGGAPGAAPWVVFEDETGTRLIAADEVGAGDAAQRDYAWGDLDRDGDDDLVAARKQPWTSPGKRANVLFMNEGGVLVDRTAALASASDFPGDMGFLTPTNDRDVQLADVNGDGWLDVVTAVFSLGNDPAEPKHVSHPRVYINLGAGDGGTWLGLRHEDARIPQLHPFADPRFYSVSTGDLDDDGDVDLFFSDGDNGGAQVFDFNNRLLINDGAGFFTDETADRLTPEMAASGWGVSSAIADVNGDGVLDIVKHSTVIIPVQIGVIYNDPADPGFFNEFDIVVNGALAPTHISVADLNNDGLPDIIQTDDGVDRYLLNQGPNDGLAEFASFTFGFAQGASDDGFGGNNLGVDLDNDGFRDVIITDVDFDIPGCNRRTHIFRNDGAAPGVALEEELIDGAVAGVPIDMLKGVHDAAVFDINGDGWRDLVLGRCQGTRVLINQPPLSAAFTLIEGPDVAAPGEPTPVAFLIEPAAGDIVPGSEVLGWTIDAGPPGEAALTPVGDGLYEGELPAAACGAVFEFSASADVVFDGEVATSASEVFTLITAEGLLSEVEAFEGGPAGWTVENDPSLTSGGWELAAPFGTVVNGQPAAPSDDAQGDGEVAFVTENGLPGGAAGAADVDFGPTVLTSPPIAAEPGVRISFAYWLFCSDAGLPQDDPLIVQAAIDAAEPEWITIDELGGSSAGAWTTASYDLDGVLRLPATVRVRFAVEDAPNDSITEAGLDLFTVTRVVCAPGCPADLDGSGDIGSGDLNAVLGGFGCAGAIVCPGDVDGDGDTDSADLNAVLGVFGETCD